MNVSWDALLPKQDSYWVKLSTAVVDRVVRIEVPPPLAAAFMYMFRLTGGSISGHLQKRATANPFTRASCSSWSSNGHTSTTVRQKIRSVPHFLQPPAIDKEPESNAKMYVNQRRDEMARTWKHILRHEHFRAKYRYVGVFFERRFQPLSVGGFFSNQRESISRCPKSPFPSKTQNRQIARTSPLSFNFDTIVCLQQCQWWTRQPSCPIILLSVRLQTTHLRHRSPARTGRYVLPASAGFVATSTGCTRTVFSYVTVRGWCLWRRNVFNLSSPTLHVREIPFLISHATFLPFPYTYRLDSSRARPAQSENIAIDNPIDWGRMDKDAIVLSAFSTQVISFR